MIVINKIGNINNIIINKQLLVKKTHCVTPIYATSLFLLLSTKDNPIDRIDNDISIMFLATPSAALIRSITPSSLVNTTTLCSSSINDFQWPLVVGLLWVCGILLPPEI